MKTTTIGHQAETAVAGELKTRCYKILDLNWKTRVCEIDIVASKEAVIYFVEVKYRGSGGQGAGFEYIGPKKLSQVAFAAKVWCQSNSYEGDYRLLGAEVSGPSFEHIELVEID